MAEELRGLLAIGVVPEILRRLFLERRSGCLQLAFGGDRADFEFTDGLLTHAVTTLPGAHLGDLLVQMGFLSTRDRDACLEIAALAREKLGETILRHGLLDAEHLAQGLALQLREVLARTLVWKGGVYTFTDAAEGQTHQGGGANVQGLDPREILLDATWTLAGDPALDLFLGDLTQKMRQSSDERLLRINFRLTPADAFLLSRVDGILTAEQLLQLSPGAGEEVKASLAGLLSVGAIEYVGASSPTLATTEIGRFEVARLAGRIESPDPFEVLGVKVDVSAEELRSTYLRLLRSCDPSVTADAELKPILHRMSTQLATAFKEIERRRDAPRPLAASSRGDRHSSRSPLPIVSPRSDASPAPPLPPGAPAGSRVAPVPRPVDPNVRGVPAGSRVAPVPKPKDPNAPVVVVHGPVKEPAAAPSSLDPSRAMEAATLASDEGRFHEALAILHEAMPRLIGHERRAARVRKARILLSVENGARLAEEELKSALGEDSLNADAHVALGGIYQERGSLALAMMEYRKALEIQPRSIAAREALDKLRSGPVKDRAEPPVVKRVPGR